MKKVSLARMINQYGLFTKDLAQLKKESDALNKQIKAEMLEQNILDAETDLWKVKYQVRKSESLNEEKVIEILKKNNIKGIIKRKEYVDEERLEDAIYAGKLSQDILNEISACKTVKETVALIIKAKGE